MKDYCQYVHDTYGRFPAYLDPMYQRLTCQAQHVDTDFYARYYPPGAVTEQHHAALRALAPGAGGRRRPPAAPRERRGVGPGYRRAVTRGPRARAATSRARLRARSASPGFGRRQRPLEGGDAPVEGVALRPQHGELGDEPVPLGPQGVGVAAGAAAAEGVDRLGGDQGALASRARRPSRRGGGRT